MEKYVECNQAFLEVQKLTNEKVDWAYVVWDDLKNDLTHPDNHRRAIAGQLLCNLAKSDPEGRMLSDFPALMELTKDPRFVTARHCIQSLWKIGMAGGQQKEMLLNGLAERFKNCAEEKNCTLIRYDIIEGFRKLYDKEKDETVKQKALDLIATEEDLKYRKKYASVWKKASDPKAEVRAQPKSDEPESDLPAGIARPAQRALVGAGYLRLEQFTKLWEKEVRQLHGMGPKALDQIRRALAAKGLSFADES